MKQPSNLPTFAQALRSKQIDLHYGDLRPIEAMEQWPWLAEPWTGTIPGCQCNVQFHNNLLAICHVYDHEHIFKTLAEVIRFVEQLEAVEEPKLRRRLKSCHTTRERRAPRHPSPKIVGSSKHLKRGCNFPFLEATLPNGVNLDFFATPDRGIYDVVVGDAPPKANWQTDGDSSGWFSTDRDLEFLGKVIVRARQMIRRAKRSR